MGEESALAHIFTALAQDKSLRSFFDTFIRNEHVRCFNPLGNECELACELKLIDALCDIYEGYNRILLRRICFVRHLAFINCNYENYEDYQYGTSAYTSGFVLKCVLESQLGDDTELVSLLYRIIDDRSWTAEVEEYGQVRKIIDDIVSRARKDSLPRISDYTETQ